MTIEAKKRYQYLSPKGDELLYIVEESEDGQQQVVHYTSVGKKAGLGRARLFLYLLPQMLEAHKDKPVYVVQGEGSADTLHGLDRVATTNPFGAGKWEPSYSDLLKNRTVYVIPTNTRAGILHAESVARSIYEAQEETRSEGSSVRIARLPVHEGGDVRTFFQEGGTIDELEDLCDKTPLYEAFDYEWQAVLPFQENLSPVERMPLDMVPHALRACAHDTASRMQVSLEAVVVPMMVMIGSVVGTACKMQPKERDSSFLVVPNLWGGLIGPPSTMKSPIMSAVLSPLNKLEDKARREFDIKQAEYKLKLQLYKKRSKDITELDEGLLEPSPPAVRRYRTDDPTTEKVVDLLKSSQRGLLIFRDELTGLLESLDKPGRDGDRSFYLQAWNGDQSYTQDRIGRGTITAPKLCVSILGGIQPTRLQGYINGAHGNENDGLLQRMQLLIYPDVLEDWKYIDSAPDKEAQALVDRMVENLANKDFREFGANEEYVFKFSPAGQDFFNQWFINLNHRVQTEPDDLMAQHLMKYSSLMPSLALLFHLTDVAAELVETGAVSLEAAEMAGRWCSFLEQHARRIYGMTDSVGARGARELGRKVKQGLLEDGFSVRDIYRHGWSGLTKKEVCEEACTGLVSMHWLRAEQTAAGYQSKSTTIYYINPCLLA